MNWIRPDELYNKLNLTFGRTACLSRPHYMLLLDVRSKADYYTGHLPTAQRVVKGKGNTWHVTGGFADVTDKQLIVVYDMNTTNTAAALPSGPLAEVSTHVWCLLNGSRNQLKMVILDGGFEVFTELYPNCIAYQDTYTVGELSRLQVLPLHVRISESDWGKLFFSPPAVLAADRVAHILANIDAHVNCSVIRDPAFGFSPEEKTRVHYCILDNDADMSNETLNENLKQVYNVCLYINAHLREERNVLVCGAKGDTTSFTVLAAYLMFHVFMDLEEAMQRIVKCYPLAVLDEMSCTCLNRFYDCLRSDSDFQTGTLFIIDGPINSTGQEPAAAAIDDSDTNKEPVSLVSTLMQEVMVDLEKQKVKRQKSSDLKTAAAAADIVQDIMEEGTAMLVEKDVLPLEPKNGTVTRPVEWSASDEFVVTRLKVCRLEEEIQWKVLHHERIVPDVQETTTMLRFMQPGERLAETLRR